MAVNKPAVRKWIKKLTSGKFKQTRGKLLKFAKYDKYGRVGTDSPIIGHCCLGVACEVYLDAQGVRGKKERYKRMRKFQDQSGQLPRVVARFFGFGNDCDPHLNGPRATHRNDTSRNSFAQIAFHAKKEFLK
jgi:curved DNA-binding protein CbpA